MSSLKQDSKAQHLQGKLITSRRAFDWILEVHMQLQARDKELGTVRAEKDKLQVKVKDLELKVKAARREAETSSAALRTAQRAKKWASPQC